MGTQGQYGQYYLYDNLLDDTTGLFAGATDSNLATIALLGGLGGGIGQPSGYYPSYGAHSAPAAQGRKRREVDSCVGDECEDGNRRRRELCADGTMSDDCSDRKRRSPECEKEGAPNCTKRKRRSSGQHCTENDVKCNDRERKRRESCLACEKNPDS